jgi:uncharacterized protein (DUF433 family)
VSEAARYAHLSPQTVSRWHRKDARSALSSKERREALSYVQLIEVAVVSAFRKAGVSLSEIRRTREYFGEKLDSKYPFAQYRFKTDGKDLFLDYEQISETQGEEALLQPGKGGQLAWREVIGRLKEFEYEREGYVVRWHLDGSQVFVDPRIAFGAPVIKGAPHLGDKGSMGGGESIEDISEDFRLRPRDVELALKFEVIEKSSTGSKSWLN